MSLLLDSLDAGGGQLVHIGVPEGGWAVVRAPQPDALVRLVAGLRRGVGGIVLDGRELGRLDPAGRVHMGLASVMSRLPDLPGVTVLEVALLARRIEVRGGAWAVALGTRGARRALADAEAHVRSLAGRTGLSRWLDREAVALPPDVAALLDLVRSLAGGPRAVVWRRPEWLPASDADDLAAVLAEEQPRVDASVVEVVAAPRT